MRILLDECVHAGVKAAFPGHAVKTVSEMGWRSAKDHTLLALAEESFDVFVTIDQKLVQQHEVKKHKLGLVICASAQQRNRFLPADLRGAAGGSRAR